MKATSVIDLVKAYCANDDIRFKSILTNLVQDEEKKGNLSLATSLKNAYSGKSQDSISIPKYESFYGQSLALSPKDKDNGLDLLDIIHPIGNLNDVALSENAMNAIKDIINEQKDSKILIEKGIKPTNRLLLFGPPGCGKTMTANAIAHELNLDIAYVKLDGLVSSFLGQTGTNIRKIFDYVRNRRIVLFLDEFDAIAKKRDDVNELGELKRVVTTLLQNLDTLPPEVFIIAATNHEQLLDSAVWRRFETSILLDQPNALQRERIILNNLAKYLPRCSIEISKIVSLTEGMSGSDIVMFVESIAKKNVLEHLGDSIDIKLVAELWLKSKALFINQDSDDYYKALVQLYDATGITYRTIEEITGIARSTLNYQVKKRRIQNGKEGQQTFLDSGGRGNKTTQGSDVKAKTT